MWRIVKYMQEAIFKTNLSGDSTYRLFSLHQLESVKVCELGTLKIKKQGKPNQITLSSLHTDCQIPFSCDNLEVVQDY